MRTTLLPALSVILALACGCSGGSSSESDSAPPQDSLDPVALLDLGTGTYLGEEGGLYPGGGNTPPASHAAVGRAMAGNVFPRDADGVRDDSNGKIVVMSIGMSNTNQEFARFIQKAEALPDLSPHVHLYNGARGGRGLEKWVEPDTPLWQNTKDDIEASGLSVDQVQVVWVKQAYGAVPSHDFPDHALLFRDDLAQLARNIKTHFPNAQLCFFTSRIYGGYSDNQNRNEPLSFETAFGVKWVLESQMNGDLPTSEAPWLAWGPYMWADGENGRLADDLIWLREDMAEDGHHPGEGALEKVADALVAFFRTEETTRDWFLD